VKKHLFFFCCFFFSHLVSAQVDSLDVTNAEGISLPSIVYFCGTGNLTLKVDASNSEGSSLSGEYEIEDISSKIPSVSANKPVDFGGNTMRNIFSKSIDLPFDFVFYGKTFRKVVVGSDGRLVFTQEKIADGSSLIDHLNDYHTDSSGNIIADYRDSYHEFNHSNLPSSDFNKIDKDFQTEHNIYSIFGAWTSLIGQNSVGYRTIYYDTEGDKFIIEFKNILQEEGGLVSMKFVLYKDSSFDIIVTQKDVGTLEDFNKNAILGIQGYNNAGEIVAQWPINNDIDKYNNGSWEVNAQPVAFHFKPKSVEYNAEISWIKNGNEVLDTESLLILDKGSLNDGDQIHAEIKYTHPEDSSDTWTEISRTIKFLKLPSDIELKSTNNCNISEDLEVMFKSEYVNYKWFFNGEEIPEATGPKYTAIEKGNYQVQITSRTDSSCNVTLSREVTLDENPIIFPWSQSKLNDFFSPHCNGESFDLQTLQNSLKQDLESDLEIEFYGDENLTNRITEQSLILQESAKIYIKILRENTPCFITRELNLEVYQKPDFGLPTEIVKKSFCGTDYYNITFDYTKYIKNWDKGLLIFYYDGEGELLTESEVENYDGSRGQPFVRIVYNDTSSDLSACSDVVEIKLHKLENPESKLAGEPIYYCSETSFTLNEIKSQLIDNPENFTFTDENGNDLPPNFSVQNNYQIIIKNKETGCESDIIEIEFKQGEPSPILTNLLPIEVCDIEDDVFDAKTTINLTDYETEIAHNSIFRYFEDEALTQEITHPQEYQTKAENQKIYVVVQFQEEGYCPAVATLQIHVNIPPKAQGLNPKYTLCYGEDFIASVDNSSEFSSIEWFNPSGEKVGTGEEIQLPYNDEIFGIYKVKLVSKEGCSYEESFEISNENQPQIVKISTDNNRIEVFAEGGAAPYEYSFDGGVTWQTSNILSHPDAPQYHIFVRSNTGCLGAPQNVYYINVNNVITPNDDGRNDYWEVKNLDKMQQVEVNISDRMGNIVFHSNNPQNLRWDGKQNGRPLPTASYWYVIRWNDPATGESVTKTGWILLKNR